MDLLQFPSSDPWLASYLTNMQMRYAAEIDSALKTIVEQIDDVRALQAAAEQKSLPPAWQEAIVVLREKLECRAAELGLQTISTTGNRLDPQLHVVDRTCVGAAPPETIMAEVQPGYLYRGRVIRPARVVTIGGDDRSEIDILPRPNS
jgi:molecular chaperone GrpE